MTLPSYLNIRYILCDFDGVFTDNKVYVAQDGQESVACDRGDGLGINILRAFVKKYSLDLDLVIISKERNPVVLARARKMGLQCYSGIDDKAEFISRFLTERNLSASEIIYCGNDLNDLSAIQLCSYSVAPKDAHPLVLQHVDFVIPRNGGDGCIRYFIEVFFDIASLPTCDIIRLLL